VDHRNISTTPVDYPRDRKPYAPDPRESQHKAEDQHAEHCVFVFDIEDMVLVGRPDDGRKWPHQ
jgi:hypothetical protein